MTADPGLLRDVAAALKDSLDKEDRDEITRLTGSDVAINLPDWAACVQSDGVLSALATRLYAMPRNGGAANAVPLIAIQLPHGLKEDNERDLAYRVLKRVSFEFRSDDEFRIAEVADLDPLDGRKEDRPDKAEKIILDIARLGLQLGDVARDIVLAHLNEWADKGNYLVCLLPPEWTDGVILERLKEFRGILVAIYGSWTINELNRMVSPLSIEKLHCVIQGEQFRHCIYARQILCNLAETNSASKRSYWWLNRNP
ncbi:MAG: hypothetical protein NT069_11995 [Planctomycetota bacterium]|nr:hypothetical protein [Planctomycetota bacterium]